MKGLSDLLSAGPHATSRLQLRFMKYLMLPIFLLSLLLTLSGCGGGGDAVIPGGTSGNFESVTITPAGGTYFLDNGISIEVPPGAVGQSTEIRFRLLSPSEIQPGLDAQSENIKEFMAGIEVEPPGLTFLQPITLSIPTEVPLSPTALPLLLIFDSVNNIYTVDPSFVSAPQVVNALTSTKAITAAPPAALALKYIKIDCANDRVVFVNLDSLPDGERQLVAASYEKLKEESDCLNNPCRCCNIDIRAEDIDYIQEVGADSCYYVRSTGSVKFNDCEGQPVETWDLSEKSVDKMELFPSSLKLGKGDSAVVDLSVLDAAGNEMTFYTIQTLRTSDSLVATAEPIDIDSKRFRVHAGEAGTATISVLVECNIPATLIVEVLDFAITPGNLCIDENQTAKFSVIASGATNLSEITWASSDTTVATVDSTGLVTSNGVGPAQISASIPTSTDVLSATANVEVKEHCVTISAIESGLAATCIEAASDPKLEPLTNTTELEITISTPLEGYGLFWESSAENVATVNRITDLTSTVTAESSGSADIKVTVDNIVTQYDAIIPVAVKASPDDYTSAWLTVPGDQIVTLTDNRDILAEPQLVDFVLEAEARCNVDLDPLDLNTEYTDFNLSGQIIGCGTFSPGGKTLGFIFDTALCTLTFLDAPMQTPPGTLSNWWGTCPSAINEEGIVVGEVWWQAWDQPYAVDPNSRGSYGVKTAFIYELGQYTFPLLTTLNAFNEDIPKSGFTDINNNRVALAYEDAGYSLGGDYLYNIDNPTGSIFIDTDPNRGWVAINDFNRAVGLNPEIFANGSVFPVPLVFLDKAATLPIFYDINNANDILAEDHFFTPVTNGSYDPATNRKYFVAYTCPFPVESGTALWIEEPVLLEGYEDLEVTCDGRDNDLDGFIDVPLVTPLTTKQQGVCMGTLQECRGAAGWVTDYSQVVGYEFPETLCDGLDNDCDGELDEGCPVVANDQ